MRAFERCNSQPLSALKFVAVIDGKDGVSQTQLQMEEKLSWLGLPCHDFHFSIPPTNSAKVFDGAQLVTIHPSWW
jgi:hypothetical protein